MDSRSDWLVFFVVGNVIFVFLAVFGNNIHGCLHELWIGVVVLRWFFSLLRCIDVVFFFLGGEIGL